MVIYLKLVKARYAPTIEEAKKLNAREVLQAFAFDNFLDDYEEAYIEANK